MPEEKKNFIHTPLVEGMRFALNSIFNEGRYADKVIEYIFRHNKKWGARDRALVAETLYSVVRHHRMLHACIQPVNDPQDYIAAYFYLMEKKNPQWKNKPEYDYALWDTRWEQEKKNDAIRESFPDWLHERGKKSWGKEWTAMMHALNQPAPVVLRVNTLQCTMQQAIQALTEENIRVTEGKLATYALWLDVRANVFRTNVFKKGWIEIQDEGSQVIGEFCNAGTGKRVIDACAGAGGKSLQLAAIMENRGRIIALDTDERKLEELKRRARRGGAQNIEARRIESTKVIKRLHESADILLLDVPCTGTGTLRRNPDAKWKLDEMFFQKILKEQEYILNTYTPMLKKGGELIYATCSIFNEENTEQIRKFLEKHSEFILEEERQLTPLHHQTDGFYMARLKKS